MKYRPKNCIQCGELPQAQTGICYDSEGNPVECPSEQHFQTDVNSGYQFDPNHKAENIHSNHIPGLSEHIKRYMSGMPTNPFKSTGNEGTDSNPMGRGPVEETKTPSTPKNWTETLGLGMDAISTMLAEIAGRVARNRQNQYDYQQQTALGMMNPMPASDYQPNAYSLYAKYGGSLKTHLTNLQHTFSNNAQMDMTDGMYPHMLGMKSGGKWLQGAINPDHKGWCTPLSNPHCTGHRRAFALMMKKKHGFHEDGGEAQMGGFPYPLPRKMKNVIINNYGQPIQQLYDPMSALTDMQYFPTEQGASFNRLVQGMREMAKGGLTPNKAREILHDGTAQGHPLTNKQRRFFGAKSKGHTNYMQSGGVYKGDSIVDYLATQGYSGKKKFRSTLADEYGIENYDFSSKKNLELLGKLRADNSLLKKSTPAFAPISVDVMMQMEDKILHPRTIPSSPSPIESPNVNGRTQEYTPSGGGRTSPVATPLINYRGMGRTQGSAPTSGGRTSPVTIAPEKPSTVNYRGMGRTEGQNTSSPGRGQWSALFTNPPTPPIAPTPKPSTPKLGSEIDASTVSKIGKAKESNWNNFWNGLSDDINNNPVLSHITMTAPGGFTPEGTKQMTRDLTINVASMVSKEKGTLAKNWFNRQEAKENPPDKNQVSQIVVPDKPITELPPIILGKSIQDPSENDEKADGFYHVPMVVDLNRITVGTRSRGDGWQSNKITQPLESKGFLFSTMGGIGNGSYMIDAGKTPERVKDNSLYVGADNNGKIKIGKGAEFKGKSYKISEYPYMEVTSFAKNPDGSYKQSGVAYNRKGTLTYPVFKTPKGEVSPNLIMNKKVDDTQLYDRMAGGKAIFSTPDYSKSIFVAGSLKHIDEQLEKFKRDNHLDKVIYIMPDNGTSGRTILTKDNKFTTQQLSHIDWKDETGGAYFYLTNTPNNVIQQ